MILPQQLSRFLSYLLRHRPKKFPLVFDRHGFVALAEVASLHYHGVRPDEQVSSVAANRYLPWVRMADCASSQLSSENTPTAK